MNDYISTFYNDIYHIIDNLIKDNIIPKDFNIKKINVDFSSKSKRGDISTNLYIILNKSLIKKDFELKNYILFEFNKLSYLNKITFSNNGFINLILNDDYIFSKLIEVIKKNHEYGKIILKNKDKNINIEYVSANPTGPVHVAHMRGAVLGDVLSNILSFVGYNVTREYYVNDTGTQINILGKSLYKRYLQLLGEQIEIEKDEYPGDYLIKIAKNILDNHKNEIIKKNIKDKDIFFKNYAVKEIIKTIKIDLKNLGILFDTYTHESSIIDNNSNINEVFKILKEKELLYEGFLNKPKGEDIKNWKPRKQLLFKSSYYGDDSDRPLKKENGEWTYFANDSAYHYNKINRNYNLLINVWGADHIGYVKRMKSIVDAISNSKVSLNIIVCQIVKLIKNNQSLKMSKREGNYILIKDLLKDVGKDPLRYYMISTKNETPIDFNIDEVIKQNKDNPVFYCQYAYARSSSVINKFKNDNILNSENLINKKIDFKFISKYEREIILQIIAWPYIIFQSSTLCQPHRITNYIENLSTIFHSFWNKGKDHSEYRLIDNSNINKTISKIIWIDSMRIVFRNAFKLIGIEANEKM